MNHQVGRYIRTDKIPVINHYNIYIIEIMAVDMGWIVYYQIGTLREVYINKDFDSVVAFGDFLKKEGVLIIELAHVKENYSALPPRLLQPRLDQHRISPTTTAVETLKIHLVGTVLGGKSEQTGVTAGVSG